jgi:hypothetical protein
VAQQLIFEFVYGRCAVLSSQIPASSERQISHTKSTISARVWAVESSRTLPSAT